MRRLILFPAVLAAVLLGGLEVLAFSPFDCFWLPPLILAAMLWLVNGASGRQAAFIGYVFGLVHFLAGVSWVHVSLGQYGGMPWYLSAAATFLFCAFLALFCAFPFWLVRGGATAPHRWWLLFPTAWTLSEWGRSHFMTGFPWLTTGYSQIDSPLAGLAPLVGVYGLSLLVAVSAGLLAWALRRGCRIKGLSLLALLWLSAAGVSQHHWTQPIGQPVSVRLVQGNIPQDRKWQPGTLDDTLRLYRELSVGPERLVVLPETALPLFEDQLPATFMDSWQAQLVSDGSDMLYGIVERDRNGRYYNAVVSLGVSARQSYRKYHLVPFGEYVPTAFGWVLKVLHIPMSDFSRGAETATPMRLGAIRAAVNICYEDAFGAEIIHQLPAANLLVNVSDDAWFGDTIAAAQHLEMSRMRALETGRYAVRATNTGITAIIDDLGRVRAQLPQHREDVLTGSVQLLQGATPYVRYGDTPVMLAALLVFMVALVLSVRRRP